MRIFTCRAVFSVFSLYSASLTLIWASWMGYLQTCSHRSRWLKMISKMHDENADLCGLKQLDLLWFILQTPIKPSKTVKCSKHGDTEARWKMAGQLCFCLLYFVQIRRPGVLRQVCSPAHTQSTPNHVPFTSDRLCKQLKLLETTE